MAILFIIMITSIIVICVYVNNKKDKKNYSARNIRHYRYNAQNNDFDKIEDDDFSGFYEDDSNVFNYYRKEITKFPKKEKKSSNSDFEHQYYHYYSNTLDDALAGDESAIKEICDEFGDFNPNEF